MSEMSPLAKLLMGILRHASWGAFLLLLLFAGIFMWQKISPEGPVDMTRQDYGFLGVLGVLALMAYYLVRSIGKEIKAHTSSGDGKSS